MLLKLYLAKMSVYLYFIFLIQIFFLVIFRYKANVFYLKIGESSYSAQLVVQMLFWNRWKQESAGVVHRPGVFTSTFLGKKIAHMQATPHVQPLSCELEWTNQKHFYCFSLKPIRDNLAPGLPRALHPRSSCAEEWSTFPVHFVVDLLCRSQPIAPTYVVWSWRLIDCIALTSAEI